MDLATFARTTLAGKTYGNPDAGKPLLTPNTGTYTGQCVSYVRQYLEAVLGIKTDHWGNAKDWWTNPKVLEHLDQLPSTATPKDGYIPVYGEPFGRDSVNGKTVYYGHIGVIYQGKLLSQNYHLPLEVSLEQFTTKGLLGFLRFKGTPQAGEGGNMLYPTRQDLEVVSAKTGWPRKALIQQDYDYWTKGIGNSQWSKGADAVWKAMALGLAQYIETDVGGRIATLQDQLAKLQATNPDPDAVALAQLISKLAKKG